MAKRKSTKAKNPSQKGTENICFTIMPFGDWFDSYYESIYTPAIEAAGLVPRRADDLYRPSAIVHDIWALTQSAKVLLADLSGKNPNVFYELGLAHAIARPAILVTESIDDVPFDLRALRVIVYDKNEPDWGRLLKENIQASIKEVLGAPLEAVLPTFLKVKESTVASVTSTEKELIALRQDMDLLKRELQSPRIRAGQISSTEAVARIRRLLAQGVSDDQIVQRLRPYGPPQDWVMRKIEQIRVEQIPQTAPPITQQQATVKPSEG